MIRLTESYSLLKDETSLPKKKELISTKMLLLLLSAKQPKKM